MVGAGEKRWSSRSPRTPTLPVAIAAWKSKPWFRYQIGRHHPFASRPAFYLTRKVLRFGRVRHVSDRHLDLIDTAHLKSLDVAPPWRTTSSAERTTFALPILGTPASPGTSCQR